ncbi:glutathione peroxidase [bacterium]|nr:glutathione peroxidase [bacterium]
MCSKDSVSTAPIYSFKTNLISGEEKSLSDFEAQVLLIVNTASKCMFTKQYTGLESLFQSHSERGFQVLGFPCNQFREQDPADNLAIQYFCEMNFSVSFPLFEKIEVNGPGTHPLYKYLKKEQPGIFGTPTIKWNFTKFLVDQRGSVLARFAPQTPISKIEPVINRLLDQNSSSTKQTKK